MTKVKFSKRMLSMLLAIVMVVGLMPSLALTASAEETDGVIDTVEELQAALNAGGEVVLGGDIDLGSTTLAFPDNVPVTINLNGKTLSRTTNSSTTIFEVEAADNVTITGNGTVAKKCTGWYFFRNYGTFKIEGGTYEKSTYTLVETKANSVTEITGGTFVLDDIISRQSDTSTISISGGNFTVNYIAVGIWSEGTTIIGGTFTGLDASVDMKTFLAAGYTYDSTTGTVTGPTSSGGTTDTTYTVAVTASPAEGGTVTGNETYKKGDSVTVTATANSGYKFVKWTENGNDVSTDASYTFIASADRDLTAVFEEITLENCVATVTINGTTTLYADFEKAVTALENASAEDNAVLKLLKDVELTDDGFTVYSGVFTLDLNGKKIIDTDEDYILVFSADNQMTIVDTAGDGAFKMRLASYGDPVKIESGIFEDPVYVYGGTLNISGGTFEYLPRVRNDGTCSITGGSFKGHPGEWVADGYAAVWNEETEYYDVVKDTGDYVVPKITSVTFNSDSPAYDADTKTFTVSTEHPLIITIKGENMAEFGPTDLLIFNSSETWCIPVAINFGEDTSYDINFDADLVQTVLSVFEAYDLAADIVELDVVIGDSSEVGYYVVWEEKINVVLATEVAEQPYPEYPTYSGQSQALVTAGTAYSGEMQYALSNNGEAAPTDGWSTDIPTATNAGTYYVWYKAVGDSKESTPVCVKATIEKVLLDVTADDLFAEVGNDCPTPTYTITGFVNGETAETAGITGTPVLTYDETPDMSKEGYYFIEVNTDGMTADNYDFNPISGGLKVLEHVHVFDGSGYTLGTTLTENDTIFATCTKDNCPKNGKVALVQIVAPEDAVYTEGMWHTASLYGYTDQISFDSEDIVYSADPVNAGTYMASITYKGVTASVTYDVEKAPVTITVTSYLLKVNSALPDLTAPGAYTVEGLADGDTVSNVVLRFVSEPDMSEKGSYTIEIDEDALTVTNSQNYDITCYNGELQIVKCVHDFTEFYLGEGNVEGDSIFAKCANGCEEFGAGSILVTIEAPEDAVYTEGMWHTASLLGYTDQISLDSEDIVYSADPVDAGTYTASITYNGVTASVTYDVEKAPLTITVTSYLLKVNSAVPDLTSPDAYTVEGLADGDTVSNVVLRFVSEPDMSEEGSYTIEIDEEALTVTNSKNYDISCYNGELQIVKCVHDFTEFYIGKGNVDGDSIFAKCEGGCEEFGAGSILVTLEAPEDAVYTEGLWHTASLFGYTDQISFDSEDIVYSADPVNAGTYTASITYNGVTASVKYEVAKRELTITADDKSVSVGGSAPEYTYTVTGWDENHDEEDGPTVSGITAVCADADFTQIGRYTITISGTPVVKDSEETDVSDNYTFTLKDGTLTVTDTYTVTLVTNGGTIRDGDVTEYTCGIGATLPTNVKRSGYNFDGWYDNEACTGTPVTEITASDTGAKTFYAKWTRVYVSSNTATTYPPTVDSGDNGDVTVTPAKPEKGDTVTVTPTADTGYAVDEIIVTDKNGDPVTVTDNGDGTYSFKQPTGKVNIKVTFKAIDKVCLRDDNCPMYDYTDLDRTAWYHDGVHYCLDNDLMVGYPDDLFMPDAGTTRAMIVTMLWRFEGEPVVNYLMTFNDVKQDAWYAEAVRWATSEGIVQGYDDTTFAPDDSITREQLATMLYRYIQKNGGGFTGTWMFLLDYADRAEVSEWAYESVCYMTMHGLMQGKNDNVFDPQGSATRAEVATLFQRYCVSLEK